MYLCARVWGLSPDQFWDMTLGEFLTEWDWRQRQDGRGRAGGLTQAEIDALMEWDE